MKTIYRSKNSGVTLIELMIAVAISLLAITAIYSLFVGQSIAMRGQQEISAVQENARIAMDVLARDIRNSGFGLQSASYAGIRIENDCGQAGHQLGVTAGVYSLAASDLIAAGDFARTTGNDACINGSDRITLGFRPRMDIASACSGGMCATQADATNNVYSIICRGSTSTGTGDCCMAMEAVCEGCSGACMTAGACTSTATAPLNPAPTVTVCNASDPAQCVATEVVSAKCNDNDGVVRVARLELQMGGAAFPTGADWGKVGGKDNSVEINGFVFRTYQLMDMDGRGAPELVYSDRTQALDNNANGVDPRWTVVATDIEDLQFSYSLTDFPTTFFNNRDLWNIPTGCAPVAGIDCLRDLVTPPAARAPAAIRVSLIARSTTQQLSNSDEAGRGLRRRLEDHAPAEDADGNVRGFKRRVLTEVIGLRNF